MPGYPVCSVREADQRLTAPGSPFEMDEAVIRGRKTRVWKHAPPTLRAVVEAAQSYGPRTYLVYEDDRVTYAAAFQRIAALSRWLVDEYGLKKGDRLAIAMRNFPEWPIAFWAGACAGAIVVPLNAWWTAGELDYALRDCGARLVIADGERIELLEAVIASLSLDVIAVRGSPIGRGWSFDELTQPGNADALPDVPLEPDDDATLLYTSGTTGKPKGALGTHRNLCTNIISSGYAAARAAIRRGEPIPSPPPDQKATLVSVPLFHATGCHSLLAAGTYSGSKLVLLRKWDAERALELIETERITGFGGVPSMAWQVLESPSLSKRNTESVERVAYGGAPAPPELVRRLRAAFPKALIGNGYGLTESSAIACSIAADDYASKPDSVGPAVPVCDLRIVDDQGNVLSAGSTGELCVYGPNVVKEYYRLPEATSETFRDGWLHTGDIARIDDEGFVYILDRAKDMLIRGGENIYCVEVEDALYSHPDVMDAAVIGMPHPVLGEEPAAVVQVVAGSTVTEQALREHVRARLAGFKVPVRVVLEQEPLPRNANGKIVKPLLKSRFEA